MKDSLRIEGLGFLDNGPYSFSLGVGKTLGLSGPSGVGKTQLLRAIVDIIPHRGEVYLDDVPCRDFTAPLWRKRIAYVPPDSAWWFDKVKEHFPDNKEGPSVFSWVDQLGLSKEVMEWQVSRLSTGERQRIALLRALINRPDVLLLDEPSSALDGHFTQKMEELIAIYQRENGVAVIWVTHDKEQLCRVADLAYVVEKNRLTRLELG